MVFQGPILAGSRGQTGRWPNQASWGLFGPDPGAKPQNRQIKPPGVHFGRTPGPGPKMAKSGLLGPILAGPRGQAPKWVNQASWGPFWPDPGPGPKMAKSGIMGLILAGPRGQAQKLLNQASWGPFWPDPGARPKNGQIRPTRTHFGWTPGPSLKVAQIRFWKTYQISRAGAKIGVKWGVPGEGHV